MARNVRTVLLFWVLLLMYALAGCAQSQKIDFTTPQSLQATSRSDVMSANVATFDAAGVLRTTHRQGLQSA